LAPEDFDKLVANLPEHLKPLVTFLYFSGVRLGEARQIEWSQVDLKTPAILLLGEQTKNGEPRIIPLTDALVAMLEKSRVKEGLVFDATNLRRYWQKACVTAGLGTLTEIDDKIEKIYAGLIIHDLRRSAVRNLMNAGVNESVAMKISGHKTNNVFKRYHIVDAGDVLSAMRSVQNAHSNRVVTNVENGHFGVSSLQIALKTPSQKLLKP
jgi:integrase